MARLNGEDRSREDRAGVGESRDFLADALGALVPQWLARRGIAARVETNEDRYDLGDPVEITIEFRNRLPVPVKIETPGPRLWGWTVDGELAASDEVRYTGDAPAALSFRPGERKRMRRTWEGRFKRTGGQTRWEQATPGEYEIAAFVATENHEPRDATTVYLE